MTSPSWPTPNPGAGPPAPEEPSATSMSPTGTPVWEIPRSDPAAVGADAGGGGRPEIAVGLAFAGGLATAILLRRLAS